MNRDKGLEWAKARAKLEANAERLWSLNEMERTGGEPDVVGDNNERRTNTSFTIVQRKVLKAAEVFATTVKRWSQEKNISQKIALLIWQLPWALSF